MVLAVQVLVPEYSVTPGSLASLSSGIVRDVDAIRVEVEKLFGTELVELYCKIINEALRSEIYHALNIEDLENKFTLLALKFWHRLTDPEIVFKSKEVMEKMSRSFSVDEIKRSYDKIASQLIAEIRKTGYKHSDDVIYAISSLLNRDLWIISKIEELGLEKFPSIILEEACQEFLELTVMVAFTLFSTTSALAALLRKVEHREDNLDKLVRQGRVYAENLDKFIDSLDTILRLSVLTEESRLDEKTVMELSKEINGKVREMGCRK